MKTSEMKKKWFLLGTLIMFIVLLTGCWDQRLIKESRLILAAGLDLEANGKILDTVVYPVVNKGSNAVSMIRSVVVSSTGVTTRDARFNLDKKVSQMFDASRNRVFLFGEKLAKKDIYSSLDVIYRDPRGSVNAMVAVVKGSAKKSLEIQPQDSTLLDIYYPELLRSTSAIGLFEIETVQSICTLMFEEGNDFLLPYLRVNEKQQRAEVIGTAMFHHNKMTGTLTGKESTLLLLMNGVKQDYPRFTFKIADEKRVKERNYITILVNDIERKMKIDISPEQKVRVKLALEMDVNVNELPIDHLDSAAKANEFNKTLTKEMNALAKKTLAKIQKANCDELRIGKRIRSFHYADWKQMNWEKDYRNISIEPDIKITIIQHGIIN
ncbi:Ger(x)C family spore germination protein [Fictibacillus fluitans]|uniref:Ger(X)C family spore germination protein n=1 Tax=Fictibacillus fluitans TaxID=3058422 RepID=A0ABT8HY21_9BACL|nr:Ger(x)C family spore germination protein [Fictibacillus sp. NE201]MDN4525673.1 Ger(x)C family spore germination protein [Fictibacillus sp. NE201]